MALLSILLLILFALVIFIIIAPFVLLRFIGGKFGFGGNRKGRGKSAGDTGRGKDGDVFVSGKTAGRQEKIVGDNIGEYIDYEEVDEKKQL